MSELSVCCNKYGISIKSILRYIDYEKERFAFTCTLIYKDRETTFDYFSGFGNYIKKSSSLVNERKRFYHRYRGEFFTLSRAIKTNQLQPKYPKVADVLYCLLSDSEAVRISFDEWCKNFGANMNNLNFNQVLYTTWDFIRKNTDIQINKELIQQHLNDIEYVEMSADEVVKKLYLDESITVNYVREELCVVFPFGLDLEHNSFPDNYFVRPYYQFNTDFQLKGKSYRPIKSPVIDDLKSFFTKHLKRI